MIEPTRSTVPDQDQRLAVRITLLLTGTMTIMAGATISPALPALAEHFHDTPNVAYLSRFLITLPSIVIAIFAPLAGLIIDRFGRKRLLIAGITLYGFAGSAGFVLDTLPGILVSRALLGLSVAAVMTVSSTLMGDYFSGRVRERFMGFRQGFIQYGGVVFLTLGGLLATVDWRAPFMVYLLAFAILPLALIFLFEPEQTRTPVNDEDPPRAKPAYLMIGMLYGIGILHSVAFYMGPTQLPFFLRDLGVTSPNIAGLAMALISLASASVSMFAFAWFRRFFQRDTIFVIAFVGFGISYWLMTFMTTLTPILFVLVLTGASLGLLFPNLSLWVLDIAPDWIRGRILGGLATSIFVGHFLSPIVSQPIADAWDLRTAYAVLGTAMLLVGLFFVVRRWRPSH
ncbi:MAG: MFS transporter [Alphaproteobacteria bacterium]